MHPRHDSRGMIGTGIRPETAVEAFDAKEQVTQNRESARIVMDRE